jgi:NAD(P)-dependent dehydrogenase (short-subunit alcohol dehydrogenase family)
MNQNLSGLGYQDKTVVITGAASGMGAAAATILIELGAKVHAIDLNEPSCECQGFYQTDVSNPVAVNETVAKIHNDLDHIDFLFCCAGVPPVLGALKCMMINYIGNRQLIEGLIPLMAEGTSIAIIASDAAMGWQSQLASGLELMRISDPVAAKEWCKSHPEFLRDGYTSSKEMILIWVQNYSVALGREKGIRINCTGPGPTGTAFIPQMETALDDGYFDNFPYPLLNRIATPEEQAWPLILLNCPLNNVVTGSYLWTDQGFAPGALTGAIDPTAIMSRK